MDIAKIKDTLNLAGSFASLTGILLLWLNAVKPESSLALAVPAYFIASLFSLGAISLALLLFQAGYKLFFWYLGITAMPGKITYVCFATGILLMLLWGALFVLFHLASDVIGHS